MSTIPLTGDSPRAPRVATVVAFAIGAAALLSIIESSYDIVREAWWTQDVRPSTVFLRTLPPWLVLCGLVPGIAALARRFPFGHGRNGAAAAIHIAATPVTIAAHFTILSTFWYVWDHTSLSILLADAWGMAKGNGFKDVLVYWGVIGTLHARAYHQGMRQRERAALELKANLAEARLQALRGQLNPHFLFNVLNTVASLVRQGMPAEAVAVLGELGDLLRQLLRDAPPLEVRLDEELDFVRRYLALEQVRFADRLRVTVTRTREAAEAQVPNLILQPLVENAVRHGVSRRAGRGHIEIAAWRIDDTLRIEVRDDGPGLARCASDAPGSSPGAGVGVRNTRERLAQLYGDAASLVLSEATSGGTIAAVTVPFRAVEHPIAPAERTHAAAHIGAA